MSTPSNDIFWIDNPVVLIDKNNWYKIIPVPNMTTNEILNAITRFCIVVIILLLIFYNNTRIILILVLVIVIVVIYYLVLTNRNRVETYNTDIIKPYDHHNNEKELNDNHYGYKTLPFRAFYKMSSNTELSDQSNFAKWLYRLPKTCKEDTSKCLRYEDIRYNRQGFESDTIQKIYKANDTKDNTKDNT